VALDLLRLREMPHKDKVEYNAYSRAYYRSHKEDRNAMFVRVNRERRQSRYVEIQKLKEGSVCTDCEGRYPYYVMDFDHRDPETKFMDVSLMVKRMFSWEKVVAEVAKCDLVCVRCHRLRTYKGDQNYRSKRFKTAKAFIVELKTKNPCVDCGGRFEACQMDFDHVGEKRDSISNLLRGGATVEAISVEISRCQLVCANCHRERTQNRCPMRGAA
jgi:hypothetical protein